MNSPPDGKSEIIRGNKRADLDVSDSLTWDFKSNASPDRDVECGPDHIALPSEG